MTFGPVQSEHGRRFALFRLIGDWPVNQIISDEVYNEALKQYKPLISKFAHKFSRNYTQKEEVQAILMAELLVALKKHDAEKSSMITYLHHRFRWICLNKVINSDIIVNKHERPISVNDDKELVTNDLIEQNDLYETLTNKLEPKEREVLIHLRAGNNLREVSDLMNISPQRVQQIFASICDKGHKMTGQKR